ncbi:MAG: ABC transporter substrate-binding protein [Blastocatellia bacterium]|nr:ABC transporter substrate-binding protein [Blastocatellia bacterium]
MNRDRSFAGLLAWAVCLVFLCACGTRKEGAANSADAALRVVTPFRIPSLEPARPASYFLVEFAIAELPLMLDAKGELRPHLLESYERIDERNWRLRARANVRFQNGKPLTAAAMAAAMSRQLRESASTRAVLPGATVRAITDRDVMLTTTRPDATVPAALADEQVFPIYDVEAVEAAQGDPARLIASGCFTGPYRPTSLDERELRMSRFEQYWQGRPPLDAVSIRFIGDPQARVLAVQNDEADLALYPPSEAQRMLAGAANAYFVTSPRSHGGPRIILNLRNAPFDEVAVRQAFRAGLDYESLARDVMEGVGEIATGFYPSIYPWAVPNQKGDPAAAARLLEAAGWLASGEGPRMKNGKPLELVFLTYPQQPDWAKIATAMQAQLAAIGVRVRIRQVDDINSAMRAAMNADAAWHAAINSPGLVTTGGAPDPFLREHLHSGGERNFGGVRDAELDWLLDELGAAFASGRRTEILRRIQQIVIEEKAYEVRPVFLRARVVAGARWRGYQPSPQLHHLTWETKAEK